MFEFLDDLGIESELVMITLPVWALICAGMLWVFGSWSNRGLDLTWTMRIIILIIQLPLTYVILMYYRNKD
ncbi:hypothetical protein LCGC14_3095720 [marine sediment metagenome]|uniref:Uncharacterized protein n=1 Tax=marine sediment metagenome TaxID=412755 RepID=A0A0F8W9B0_9ZZZZ